MRISDWSSDVCSSDLALVERPQEQTALGRLAHRRAHVGGLDPVVDRVAHQVGEGVLDRLDDRLVELGVLTDHLEIGRASCREKRVSVRVDLGGRRIIKKKKTKKTREQ